jgi:hypothetical protein
MYVMYCTFKMRTNYIFTLSVKGLFEVIQMSFLSKVSLFFLNKHVFFSRFLSSAVPLKRRRKCHSTFPVRAIAC